MGRPSTRGKLLVALPAMADPNFDRTIVYIVEHQHDGAFGLILNRPTDEPVLDGLAGWHPLLAAPAVLFGGGPVQLDAFVALATLRGDESADDDERWSPIGNGLATVDLSTVADEAEHRLGALRIFRGYAGWGPGQLDGELSVDAWRVVDTEPGDVFSEQPDDLWRAVLRRQPGRLGWLADFPDDLSVN